MWLWVALVGLAACSAQKADPSREVAPADEVPGQIVVDFKDGVTQAQIDSWEQQWGVDLTFNSVEGPKDGVAIASGVADVDRTLAKIRQDPNVESAEPMLVIQANFVPNDPDYAKQWNLKLIEMPKAWELTHGKGVTVAVIDTGIAYENFQDFRQVPDLKGVKFAKGYDFVNDTEHPDDDHGHGTHVAGTIAQATNNGEGVAGIAFEATLMPLKVLNHFGQGNSADIADAIRFAADHGAQVINLSLGGGSYSSVMASAVEYATKKNVTVVAAAGNGGRAKVEFPAAYPGAVAVGAVGPTREKAPYSSWGKELDLVAPGGDKSKGVENGILQNTVDPRDHVTPVYAYYQGTSMAAPHVAGVAALLYAAGATTPAQVEQALYAGATPLGNAEWSEQTGHGLLNAEGALRALHPSDFSPDFHPLIWAAILLAGVLLTLGRRQRPAYFQVLFHPKFLIPLVLSTVGIFVANWVAMKWHPDAALDLASLPIPDWGRWLFGRGRTANPFFYSALIPLLGSFLAIGVKGLRPVLGGLSVGFAGFLAYAWWSKAPALAYLPFSFLAGPWLLINTFVCLFIARALLQKETAR
jgi:serine protease